MKLLAEIAQHARAPFAGSSFAYEDQLADIRCPTLVLGGTADRIATPTSVAAVVDRLGGRDVRWRQFGTLHGEGSDYGHLDLLIGRHAPEDIYLPVLDFCREHDT